MVESKIDEKIREEIKIREAKYGYLPLDEGTQQNQKTLVDEIIEWLKSRKEKKDSIEKIKKAL